MLQKDMLKSFIKAETEIIENKHSGKYISNINFDVDQITKMLAEAYLTIFKDGLTLIGLLGVMFFQNWKLSLIAIIMIPLATVVARTLGKRITKATKQTMDTSALFTSRLVEIFKNHRLTKIFQKEYFSPN